MSTMQRIHETPSFSFFFNDTATTEIYTLSLHDALPIYRVIGGVAGGIAHTYGWDPGLARVDRKSTRLNSSHSQISYAVFCLKKKTKQPEPQTPKPKLRQRARR